MQLGLPYGTVKLRGMTLDEAQAAMEKHLAESLKKRAPVMLSLREMSGKQMIAGEHLVNPDGTVTLGSYGSVDVVGMTLAEAKVAIEKHLAKYLEDPEISIEYTPTTARFFT